MALSIINDETLGNITISPTDNLQVGTTITITVVPNTEYSIDTLLINGNYYTPEYNNSGVYSLQYILANTDTTIYPNYIENNKKDGLNLTSYFFDFDPEHPVTMTANYAHDGSIDLVLTDNKNKPRMINTGFKVTANNTCEVIKRPGKYNTNRYNLADKTDFDLQTSLYREYDKLAKFVYNGLDVGGQLKVGNYCFYAVNCDKDGNESDVICESGMVLVFKGTDGDPFSVLGGLQDERTDKAIKLLLVNLDESYHYIKLYYSRTTAANNLSAGTTIAKCSELYTVENGQCSILFTGYEETETALKSDINARYFNPDVVKTQAISLNMLFLGNLTEKARIITTIDEDGEAKEIEEDLFLRNLSLKIIPTFYKNIGINLNSDYLYL